MQPLLTTWMMLRDGDEVILGLKKQRFGEGNINGIGGKVDAGETPRRAAIRETYEEIGVKVTKLEKVATITFDELLYRGRRGQCIMHCYIASEWQGEPVETAEMKPQRFLVDEIPYEKMFGDDKYWVPLVLAGKKVRGRFLFNDDFEVVEHEVEVLPDKMCKDF